MSTRVAAVQLPFTYFNTPQEFADHVRTWIEQAANGGAQLILLPHLTSLMLFGMFEMGAQPTDSLDALARRQKMSVPEWLNERAGYVFEFYLHLFQSLASRVEAWLAPGTALELENDALYLTAFLFNPAGEIVGRQRQMHPTKELEWGLSHGDTLRVFNTEVGDFGIVIGSDIHDPAVARTLVRDGANILLHPAANRLTINRAENPQSHFTQELVELAEANRTFIVHANLAGGSFRGRSAIYASAEMTGDKQGVLAQARTDSDGETIFANLEMVKT